MSQALIKLEQAAKMLAEAKSVPEIMDFKDNAEAMAFYCKQKGLGLRATNAAQELVIRAIRRLGAYLVSQAKPVGRPHKCKKKVGAPPNYESGKFPEENGVFQVTKDQAKDWKKMASVPEEVLARYFEQANQREEEISCRGVIALTKPTKPKFTFDEEDESPELCDSLDQPVPSGLLPIFRRVAEIQGNYRQPEQSEARRQRDQGISSGRETSAPGI